MENTVTLDDENAMRIFKLIYISPLMKDAESQLKSGMRNNNS